ncbi:MAG: hypothetical protein HPPSJP_3300 [Candidatus Hepatoplasma scabrum]|nr:MAG: hypothetical protein HPPSJP_3300 [Candidatus Hepatoplasma sp.]
MKKCLITTKNLKKERINYLNYDFFIGVEKGAKFISKNKKIKNKYYISDFDSLKNYEDKLQKTGKIIILEKEKDFSDVEEAIKYAILNGYKNNQIELFVNENLGRKDHLFNIFNLARKYEILVYGNKFKITPIKKNQEKIIKKDRYKYLSIFIFEKTIITTSNLKWDLKNREFNPNSSTNLISNEITKDQAKIKSSNLILIVQAND